MTKVPLARVPPATPLSEAALSRHLAGVRLPSRSAMLLHVAAPGGDTRGESADGGGGPVLRQALRALVSHLASGASDHAGVQHAVCSLAGLGPGLTPTGDDILIALVATSRRLADGGLLSPASADRLAEAVAAIPDGRTTPLAQRLLSETARGLFPAPLACFVEALGNPGVDGDTLSGLAVRLTAVGAHSGADWLAGTLALAGAAVAKGGMA